MGGGSENLHNPLNTLTKVIKTRTTEDELIPFSRILKSLNIHHFPRVLPTFLTTTTVNHLNNQQQKIQKKINNFKKRFNSIHTFNGFVKARLTDSFNGPV